MYKRQALDANVLSGNVSIVEGRMVTPEDTDVCVISEELAEKNGLKAGDTIGSVSYTHLFRVFTYTKCWRRSGKL